MIDFDNFTSLFQIADYFSTEQICKDTIAEERWENGKAVCPYCGCTHCYSCGDGRYFCSHCDNKFSVLVGTIFENTKISLRKWFMAMYLISSHKKGISSCQLARDIKVTQKTAWFMLHKIRTTFAQVSPILENEVEIDETYVGGRETNKHESKKVDGTQGRSTKTKTPVFGIAQREGNVFALKVEDTRSATLMPIIKSHIKTGSIIYTDETNIYCNLNDNGYNRQIVNHSQKEFAVGRKYTNTIEGFWGQFKRMVYGTYHFVSRYYMQRYVDEAVFRYNNRKKKGGERFAALMTNALNVVTFEEVKVVKCAA